MENNLEEIWTPWATNGRYLISNLGKVMDTTAGREMSINVLANGYNKVSLIPDETKFLYEPDYRKSLSLHRLVAIIYVPNPENLPEVNHKDRDKSNCAWWNLEWCTHQYNIQHSFDTGRVTPSGKDHWNFGKTCSAEQKHAMSLAKIGENHPKFKGWYVKDNAKYASSSDAEKATGECSKTIMRHAKANKNGWAFLPKPTEPATHITGTPDQVSNTVEWNIARPDTIPTI